MKCDNPFSVVDKKYVIFQTIFGLANLDIYLLTRTLLLWKCYNKIVCS